MLVDRVPPEKPQGTGIHWQVSQSTSLMNIVFEMSTATNTSHQGIFFFCDIYQSFSIITHRNFHGKRKVGAWIPIFIIKLTNWSKVVDLWVISCSMEVTGISKFKPLTSS